MATIAERVTGLIANELGLDEEEVAVTNHLGDDLGADSVDRLQLTLRLEEEFGVDVPDTDGEQLQLVQDVIAYIERKTEARSAGRA